MPLNFRINPELGVVHVRYSGIISPEETLKAFGDYMKHPDCRPGQKQLVDLRAITEVDFDFPTLLRMQAKKAERFHVPGASTLVAYLAGSPETIRIAVMAQQSWDGVSDVIARMFSDETHALGFLGLPVGDIDALFEEPA